MLLAAQRMLRSADAAIAHLYLAMFRERDALMTFLFHSLFRNQEEIALNLIDPLQRTTVASFRRFVEYYRDNGYRFIGPQELLEGLPSRGKFALITFDDGYFNNSMALPVLEEFDVPAVFFVSTDHVRDGKCFWWDVLYRELRAQGFSPRQIHREGLALKNRLTSEIEEDLKRRFGEDALRPRGDIDRPFSPGELKEFAAHRLVHLGNHTAGHAILTNYTGEQVREQIAAAQSLLESITGATPRLIAYPNGAFSDPVVQACRSIGLQGGFTVRATKNRLPIPAGSPDLLQLGRFAPVGERPIETDCRTYRSDFLIYDKCHHAYARLVRGKWVN